MWEQKLREWRWQGIEVLLLDLQNPYLQIHIDIVAISNGHF